jgi:DNA-binding SARP family transcriptional activator
MPVPTAPGRPGRAYRIAAGLGAGAVLVGYLLGLPLLLWRVGGDPVPSSLPSLDEVLRALARPDDGTLLTRVLVVAGWLAWAGFALSLAGEIASRLAGRRVPALPGLRTHRRLAGILISALAAIAVPAAANAGPTAAPTTAVAATLDPQGSPPGPGRTTTPEPGQLVHQVARGEALLDLQDRYGLPWKRIAQANHGIPQPDGRALQPGQTRIYPGWQLRIPTPAELVDTCQIMSAGDGHPPEPDGQAIPWRPTPPAGQPSPPPAAKAEAAATSDHPQTGSGQLVHTVAEGDWMWHVAGRYLGDPERYPEIAALNPDLAGRYRDYPDHIEPGDQLRLPAGAEDRGPRAHATGQALPAEADRPLRPPSSAKPTPVPPPSRPDLPEETTGCPTPDPPPVPPRQAPDPDGVALGNATPPATSPDLAEPEPTGSPCPPLPPRPNPEPVADDLDQPPTAEDGDGLVLPDGSWIPWTVAAAVAAAMAVVWLQRRRRYTPHRLDAAAADGADDGEEPTGPAVGEPAVVARIRRALRGRSHHDVPETETDHSPQLGRPDAEAARPAARRPEGTPPPVIEPLPEGGTGIVGPGAEAAARAALVAALAAGGPADPDAQAQVVVPADTMVTLLGADAVALGTWQRLRVTPDLETALAAVEARLLGAARLLDEYELTGIAALRAAHPAERPVPPLLLVAAAPPADARMRTRNALGLGRGLEVSALLLGQWSHGPTVRVQTDGTCRPLDRAAGLPDGVPPRMPVLEQQTAVKLLRTLREAHTGQPGPPAAPDPETSGPVGGPTGHPPPAAGHGSSAPVVNEKQNPAGRDHPRQVVPGATQTPPTPPPAVGETRQMQRPAVVPTAVVRVLGPPEIVGWQQLGRPVRKAAVELLVYLATHPDGAGPEQIQEDIWPETRRRLAAAKLHTAASNLRHLLAAAAGADPQQAGAYLAKHRGRYRLPADAVEVDLWKLHHQYTHARRSTDPTVRIETLQAACRAYHGELAAGRDYQWVTGHREAARRLALDAHTSLAEAVGNHDPAEAARLLLRAVDIDPMAEAVYRQAMRAHHRIGDSQTIRDLLRRLAHQLDTVGAEPADQTIELAEQLHRDLNQRPGRPGDT